MPNLYHSNDNLNENFDCTFDIGPVLLRKSGSLVTTKFEFREFLSVIKILSVWGTREGHR